MEPPQKRATVYFDPALYRALCLKATENERSISDLVNEAVRQSLAEDAADLLSFDERRDEPELSFESVVNDLKRLGAI